MKQCINGHLVDDSSNFCPQCGAEVFGHSLFCPHCGQKCGANENFCIKCGTPLHSKNISTHNATSQFVNTKPKTTMYIVAAVCAVVLLGIGGFIGWKYLSKDHSLKKIAYSKVLSNVHISRSEDYSLKKIAEVVNGCNNLGDFHEGRAWFGKNEKIGFVDQKGNVIVPAKYCSVADFKEGRAWVANEEGDEYWCGYIDLDGKEVVPIKYRAALGEGGYSDISFSEGLAAVDMRTDNGDSPIYGYIDKMGNEVIPAKFRDVEDFRNGIASVRFDFDDPAVYIDKTGKVLTAKELKSHHEIVTFWQGDKMGLKHLDGNVVVPGEYDIIQNYSEGMAAVCKGNRWGYVDSFGNNIIPCLYHSRLFYDNGVMDGWGEYGAPDEANDFHEGLVMIMKNGKAGFLDKQGNVAISFLYERAKDFSEGFAAVKKAGKWGFINKEGKNVIPCQYDKVASFREGLVAVVKNGKSGYINTKGKEIVPFIYDKPEDWEPLHDFHEGLAVVRKNGACGYVDKKGKSTFDFI